MALTLVEASKLSNDVLLKGVIETIITESQLLMHYPFIDIVGNGLTYNREATLPLAGFYAPGGVWTESTPTFTQHTASLSILGGDADVDEFLRITRSNIQNLKSIVTEMKSKAVARKFDDTLIYGDVALDALSFDGWHKMMGATQQIHAGAAGTGQAGSIRKLKALTRLVLPGSADFLIMSRATLDNLSDYAERNESPIKFMRGEFGAIIPSFKTIPVITTDWILQTEDIVGTTFNAKTGGLTTSIFAAKFGEGKLVGCQNGGINTKDLGDLETKDATRTRIKWYCSTALLSELSLARYDGITDAAWGA